MRVVVFGKEPAGAQNRDIEPVGAVGLPTQRLGGELGQAVNVARRRRRILVEPGGLRERAGAERFRDHQRSGRGKDEAVVARRDRGVEQVSCPLDVDRLERAFGVADDVRLVQSAGVNHRFDAVLAERALDQRLVGDRSDHCRVRARRDVQAGHLMTHRTQPRREKAAKPPG